MHADLIIQNAYILTVDSLNTEIPLGTIVIKNDSIEALGDNSLLEYYEADNIIDAQGNLVMPGLINAHTHAAMNIYRGMADDMPLKEWLNEYIFPVEAEFNTAENIITGTELAVLEMLKSGTTCFADMYYFSDEIAQVCSKAGIRGIISEGILDFPVPNSDSADESLAYTEKLIDKYKDHPLVQIAVGPHSTYTCSLDNLKKARSLANKYNVPFQIHLAETAWEFDKFIKEQEITPTRYLADNGILEGRTIGAHVVYASEDDLELLMQANTGVATNPVSNMKLASGIAPIPAFLQRGITVGLGTDGAVSNNNLDMFQEMKTLALIHKQHNSNPALVSARQAIRMATIDGAKLFGLEETIGSLEVGKKADMIIVNINQPHMMPLYNIESQLVYSATGADVETVIVNGKILIENKHASHINEIDLMFNAQKIAHKVMEFLNNKI